MNTQQAIERLREAFPKGWSVSVSVSIDLSNRGKGWVAEYAAWAHPPLFSNDGSRDASALGHASAAAAVEAVIAEAFPHRRGAEAVDHAKEISEAVEALA